MKELLTASYKNSFLYEVILWITDVLIPRLKSDFLSSRTLKIMNWVERRVLNNKYLEIFFNTQKVGEAWYASAFYRYTTFGIRHLAFHIPRSRIKFKPYFIGLFMLFVLLFPDRFWDNFYMVPVFTCIAIIFISRTATHRTGVIFILINILITMFIIMMSISIPIAACKTLSYFLLAVDLFFMISFAVRTQGDLEDMLMYLFLAAAALCMIGVVQALTADNFQTAATGVYGDSEVFAEILVMLFPFAFVYPTTLGSGLRRLVYSVMIMALSFWVITATQSKAAFIAYFIELFIVIVLIDRRYVPMILLLAPTFSGRVINNIVLMWNRESGHGNIFQNIVSAFRGFWTNGFGVSTSNFVDLYSSSLHYGNSKALINLPNVSISPIYFHILVDVGTIFMIGFMYYILRIAHSSITCMFRATPRQKLIFAAGLAALLGISISSLLESSLFEPRVLIMYWAMLGLLRSGRIIKLGILD